jgi:ADP-ribose pyrophosphatase YjhB (NUDIX family)
MNQVRVGVSAIIIDDNKILLGHRSKNKKDTGGIVGRDTWSLPGGKQEYDETIIECAIRETKEECNLDIVDPKIIYASDDIAPDRHFVTITTIASNYSGEVKVMEPDKEDEWKWFDINNLPDNLYPPSKQGIVYYKENIYGK